MPDQSLHTPQENIVLAGYMKWVFPFLRYFFHKIRDPFICTNDPQMGSEMISHDVS
jgi:hypothetical protein